MVRGIGTTRLSRWFVAPLAVGALALSACAPGGADDGDGSSSAGGDTIPVGSKPEAYAEALADVDPITLNLGGLTTGPGTPTTDAFVEYGELVEEMSGGKVKFKFDFAGAKVPLDKMADGLGQGRMDMGLYIPGYQPDDWPVAALIGELSVYHHPNPITGRMATLAAQKEFGQTWEPLQEEADGHGIQALYPQYSTSHDIKLQCAEGDALTSLDDLKGKQVRISAPGHHSLAEALGMTPVSLTFPELFQGLQRGVVDCAVNSVGSHVSGGFIDITENWTMGTEPMGDWGENPSGWGISQKVWNGLPIAAQQLLWDTQPQMLALQMKAGFASAREAMDESNKAGFSFGTYDADVTEKMKAHFTEVEKETAAKLEEQGLAEDGMAVVEEYKGLYDKWWKIVTEDLGYPADTSWETLADDFDAEISEIDADAFTQRFYDEVLLPNRPE